MEFLLVLLSIFFSCTLVSGLPFVELIQPNFSGSYLHFMDSSGSFLVSQNATFKVAICNPDTQLINFYLCITHVASNTVIWSANRNTPFSEAGMVSLTATGLTISDGEGNKIWSTPAIQSSVNALLLNEMGNLVLVDHSNSSLWESFHNPTDTIVIGQYLPAGTLLFSSVSDSDWSTGDYSLGLTSSDAVLQWYGQTYWKFSMGTNAFTNSNYMVEFMTLNRTGVYLVRENGTVVVIQVVLASAEFRTAKLDASGQFRVSSFSSGQWKQEFWGPSDSCQIPLVCGRVGLCSEGSASRVCSCPSNFHLSSPNSSTCVPIDSPYSLFSACNSSNNVSKVGSSYTSYVTIGYGYDYFSNDFSEEVKYGVNLSVCQDVCSSDCSCFGVFYDNASGICHKIENKLGSLMTGSYSENDLLGFIKVVAGTPNASDGANNFNSQSQKFPLVALVLLPSAAFVCALLVLGVLWLRRRRISRNQEIKLGQPNSPSSEELDAFNIPGLPRRFDYKELEVATDNFKIHIGSGGFGSVYKGTLLDETDVAVKKITNLGIQGKKDFCTEIAVIGNIHHVNLVKLKGFCAQGRACLLVYEYMNHGSLDRILFGNGPVLEWRERFNIALGTARGLAYLHSGCEQKIIHCDIKPENILLHDHFRAKISDFGLSKLLSPEQSCLFTTMRGTRGYLAPEWLTNSAISEKTDVYSFGMVLLEIVSGRKNCMVRTQSHSLDDDSGGSRSSSSSGLGLLYFPLFALEMHEQGRYLDLVDPRLQSRVTSEDVEILIRIALCCVHEEPSLRPNMVSVVGMLEGGIQVGQPRVESLNFLRFYGRRFTEASTLGGESGVNHATSYSRENVFLTSTIAGSHKSLSYISSQQVSGPR